MNIFISLILAAIIVETIISYASEIVEEHKINWKKALSMGLGIFFSIIYGLNLVDLLGFSAGNIIIAPTVGMILTGIVISRGSNGVYDLAKRINSVHEEKRGLR